MPARTPAEGMSCRLLREVLDNVPAPLNYPPQNRVATRSQPLGTKTLAVHSFHHLRTRELTLQVPTHSPNIRHAQSWMSAPLGSTAQAEALRVKRFKSFSLRPRCLVRPGNHGTPWVSPVIFPNNDPTTQTAEGSAFCRIIDSRNLFLAESYSHILLPLAIPSIPSPKA